QPNETWASRYHPGFGAAVRFLMESSETREVERAEREQQRQRLLEAQREQEKARFQARYAWRMLAVGIAAVVLILGFAVLAIYQAREATEEKNRADNELQKAQTTEARYLAALARQRRKSGDAGTAILLALEALSNNATGAKRRHAPEVELQLDGA